MLIVDDNATNRRILVHQTGSWGMIASEADSGNQALGLLRAAAKQGLPYDIAILDLMMPEMDGFELAESIKADPSIAAAELVLLPSFSERGHGERARQLGIAAYLQKPVRQSKLYDCLTAVMARSGVAETITAGRLITRHSRRKVDGQQIPKAFSNVRIIIAEDNLVNQKVAIGQLRNLGYRAKAAPNGRELLEALEKADFDLILMDLHMPDMDGFAVTAEIRRREGETRHTTIIAMTAKALQGDDEACLAAGMDDYISKPVKPEVLRQKLERWTTLTEIALSGEESSEAEATADNTRDGIIDSAQFASLRAIQEPGQEDLVTELIDLFINQTVIQMEELYDAVAANDVTEVRRVAHFLMGSSVSIGARQLAALYQQLVRRDGVSGDNARLLERLDQEFKLVCEALQAERRGTAKRQL